MKSTPRLLLLGLILPILFLFESNSATGQCCRARRFMPLQNICRLRTAIPLLRRSQCEPCLVSPPCESDTSPLSPSPVSPPKTRLFDGSSLKGWTKTQFGGEGEISVEDGAVILDMGIGLTGIHLKDADTKTDNYELFVSAKRVEGEDMVCGITFPVGDQFCSLIVGGWGGSTVGISSIDNRDASDNETTKIMKIEHSRWYQIRIQVTGDQLTCWLDKEKIVDLNIKGKKLSLRGDCDLAKPIGIFSFGTKVAIKDIFVRDFKKP